jgi:hypothetical protein
MDGHTIRMEKERVTKMFIMGNSTTRAYYENQEYEVGADEMGREKNGGAL